MKITEILIQPEPKEGSIKAYVGIIFGEELNTFGTVITESPNGALKVKHVHGIVFKGEFENYVYEMVIDKYLRLKKEDDA